MKRVVLLFLLVLLLLWGCAFNSGLSPIKRAVLVRESFNELLAEWIYAQDQFDVDVQEKVNAYFRLAHDALNAYENAVEVGESGELSYDEYLRIKRDIFELVGEEMGWTSKNYLPSYHLSQTLQLLASS